MWLTGVVPCVATASTPSAGAKLSRLAIALKACCSAVLDDMLVKVRCGSLQRTCCRGCDAPLCTATPRRRCWTVCHPPGWTAWNAREFCTRGRFLRSSPRRTCCQRQRLPEPLAAGRLGGQPHALWWQRHVPRCPILGARRSAAARFGAPAPYKSWLCLPGLASRHGATRRTPSPEASGLSKRRRRPGTVRGGVRGRRAGPARQPRPGCVQFRRYGHNCRGTSGQSQRETCLPHDNQRTLQRGGVAA